MRRLSRALYTITAPQLGLLEPLLISMRVWPSDLNLGMHMDNVRYLQLMNSARNEFFLRSGLRRLTLRRRIGLPLAACEVRYRRPLLALERFELHTELLGWDDRRFYIQQIFRREQKVAAEGLFRCAVTEGAATMAPGDLFSALTGPGVVSPELPGHLQP